MSNVSIHLVKENSFIRPTIEEWQTTGNMLSHIGKADVSGELIYACGDERALFDRSKRIQYKSNVKLYDIPHELRFEFWEYPHMRTDDICCCNMSLLAACDLSATRMVIEILYGRTIPQSVIQQFLKNRNDMTAEKIRVSQPIRDTIDTSDKLKSMSDAIMVQ